MFKSFLDGLTSSTGGVQGSSSGQGTTPAELRADIYSAIDLMGPWLLDKAGNGIDYRTLLAIVERHFPGTQINRCDDEIPVLVGGVTNMVLEYSKTDGIPAAMALRTLTDRLVTTLGQASDGGERKEREKTIGDGIVRALNTTVDPALLTRELAPRVQMMSSLGNLTAAVYGKGSAEARNADVVWSSRFI